MRIKLEDVIEHSKISPPDIKWLSESKTRIKLIIKKHKLEENVIRYLWSEVTLRRPLVKDQNLPDDIIDEIINLTLDNKRRHVSSSVYKETLLNQNIKDEHIEKIWSQVYSTNAFTNLITLSKTLPQKLISVIGLQSIIDDVVKPKTITVESKTSICSAIIHYDNSLLDDIAHAFLDQKDVWIIDNVMSTFSKIAYFNDELVDDLYQAVDEMSFYHILQSLMSRNNCSYYIQAKYLLNK